MIYSFKYINEGGCDETNEIDKPFRSAGVEK